LFLHRWQVTNCTQFDQLCGDRRTTLKHIFTNKVMNIWVP
jgi:hypothetical protein